MVSQFIGAAVRFVFLSVGLTEKWLSKDTVGCVIYYTLMSNEVKEHVVRAPGLRYRWHCYAHH